jgi:hypothetical protein
MAAATTDLTTYPGNFNLEKSGTEAIQTRARFIDCAALPIAQNAVVKLFHIPAGCKLLTGYTVSDTAEATVTFAIGNAATADTLRSAAIIGAAGTTVAFTTVSTHNVAVAGAANEIQMTVAAAAAAAAKFWIVITYIASDAPKN